MRSSSWACEELGAKSCFLFPFPQIACKGGIHPLTSAIMRDILNHHPHPSLHPMASTCFGTAGGKRTPYLRRTSSWPEYWEPGPPCTQRHAHTHTLWANNFHHGICTRLSRCQKVHGEDTAGTGHRTTLHRFCAKSIGLNSSTVYLQSLKGKHISNGYTVGISHIWQMFLNVWI